MPIIRGTKAVQKRASLVLFFIIQSEEGGVLAAAACSHFNILFSTQKYLNGTYLKGKSIHVGEVTMER